MGSEFWLDHKIDSGSFGEIYIGMNSQISKEVTIKLLSNVQALSQHSKMLNLASSKMEDLVTRALQPRPPDLVTRAHRRASRSDLTASLTDAAPQDPISPPPSPSPSLKIRSRRGSRSDLTASLAVVVEIASHPPSAPSRSRVSASRSDLTTALDAFQIVLSRSSLTAAIKVT